MCIDGVDRIQPLLQRTAVPMQIQPHADTYDDYVPIGCYAMHRQAFCRYQAQEGGPVATCDLYLTTVSRRYWETSIESFAAAYIRHAHCPQPIVVGCEYDRSNLECRPLFLRAVCVCSVEIMVRGVVSDRREYLCRHETIEIWLYQQQHQQYVCRGTAAAVIWSSPLGGQCRQ